MDIEIKILGDDDEAVLENIAPEVFDHPINTKRTREFLRDPRHHMAVAIDQGQVVGFVSAVHYVHPDKAQPELWINEIAVASSHRVRGVGKGMLDVILAFGRKIGCSEAWVLTERANIPAMKLYASRGGTETSGDTVMFTFYPNAACL